MIYKFYGPPGTGKTYRLISRAKAYVRTGTPLDKIGYFAFTKKAAEEARNRMPAENKKLKYFQTLHSFGYKTLGLDESRVLQPEHYQTFGKRIGVRVKFTDRLNKQEIPYLRSDNPYFKLIQKAENKLIEPVSEYNSGEYDRKVIKKRMLTYIYNNMKEYKKTYQLYDFNDMIRMLTESNKIPQFKVIFIDEAQDLSPLQWKLFDKLKEYTEDMYLAGDDDQAIYAWAGADVKRFIEEPAKEKVLKFSKRISETIQSESKIPISRIKGIRKKKEYLPRNYKGKSQYISNLSQVNLLKDKWLILTRTQQTAANIMTELKNKNLYYMFKTDKSYQVKLYKKIKNYLRWCNGEVIEDKEMNDILKLTDVKEITHKIQWYKLFTKAPIKEKTYILKLMEQGENLDEDARIRVSTIHSIKGGEEDNVILFMHQGSKIQKSIKRSIEKQDEEHRVWYVAITRARNNLYKLKTKNKLTEYNI